MGKLLNLVWQFKWAAVATMLIEWLILMPAVILMFRFGEANFAANLSITPFGSAEYIGVFFDALANNAGLSYSLMAYFLVIPLLFLTRLALATGTIAGMQQREWKITLWLSEAGRHLLPALGLCLRWVLIPLVLCGLCFALTKIAGASFRIPLYILLAAFWFTCLSWFSFSLNVIVQKEKKALRKGFKLLRNNLALTGTTIVIFIMSAAVIKLAGWVYFKSNGAISTHVVMAIIGAVCITLATRFLVLYWHASHVVGWRRRS